MKRNLILFFVTVILAMFAVTTWASGFENVISATLRLVNEPWVVATLFDAYFGFLTFFLWVCYKEESAGKRVVWFIAIMLLGNFAMAAYALKEIRRLKEGFTTEKFLISKNV